MHARTRISWPVAALDAVIVEAGEDLPAEHVVPDELVAAALERGELCDESCETCDCGRDEPKEQPEPELVVVEGEGERIVELPNGEQVPEDEYLERVAKEAPAPKGEPVPPARTRASAAKKRQG